MQKSIGFKVRLLSGMLISLLFLVGSGKAGAITFHETMENFKNERDYRKNFITGGDTLEDLRKSYRPSPSDYTNYYELMQVIKDFEHLYNDLNWHEKSSPYLAESVNELLQAQTLIASHYIREAWRIRYPIPEDPQTNPTPSASGPVRDEVKKMAAACDEYSLALSRAFEILREYDGVFRSRSDFPEDFETFPQFITFQMEGIQGGGPQPLLNELWQITNTAYKKATASYSVAYRLFGLSHNDDTARQEAIDQFKKCAHEAFLNSAILSAAQTPDDFQLNRGQKLKLQVVNARDMHRYIEAGLTPLGDDGKFIPNVEFESYLGMAKEAVDSLKEVEVEMHNDTMEYYNTAEAALREIQAEREKYLDSLESTYGVHYSQYNNLQYPEDQAAYVNEVVTRMKAVMNTPTDKNAADAGNLGIAVLRTKDAILNIDMARDAIMKIPAQIDIIERETNEFAEIYKNNAADMKALEVAVGVANAFAGMRPTLSVSYTYGGQNDHSVTVGLSMPIGPDRAQFKIGKLRGQQTYLRYMEQIEIREIQAAAQIKRLLLDQKSAVIAFDMAVNQLTMAHTEVNILLNELDNIIQRMNQTRLELQDIWYKNPSFAVEVSTLQKKVENRLHNAVKMCYQAARVLEYKWVEDYENPFWVHLGAQAYLTKNKDYDKFEDSFCVFSSQRGYDCEDFLAALRLWDLKLREGTNRGPKQGKIDYATDYGEVNRWISICDDILGFKQLSIDRKISLFREYIQNNLKAIPSSPYKVLVLEFPTIIDDCNMFGGCSGAYLRHWNKRIGAIGVDIEADSGFTDSDAARVYLIQTGTITLRRFPSIVADEDFYWTYNTEREYNASFISDQNLAEDLMRSRLSHSAFLGSMEATINNQQGYHYYIGNPNSLDTDLKELPVACDKWLLIIDMSDPLNQYIDFSKIKDIKLLFFYKYGNPREFNWAVQ